VTEQAEVFEIDDAETLEMLADPTRVEMIERLFDPASVTELAEAMEMPRTRLYHHVRLLEEAGMITVVQTRQRGAIPEKVYQATAKSYQPSDRLLAESPPRQVATVMVDSLLPWTRADIIRSVAEGRVEFGKRVEHRKRAILARHVVALSAERRHEFITELAGLLDRYRDDDPDGEPVAATILVYPSSRNRGR
jgi:DNA-binding transcriptional ArsR family regulator